MPNPFLLQQIANPRKLQIPSPVDTAMTGLQLKNMMQAGQIGDIQLQNAQQGQVDQQTARAQGLKIQEILVKNGGDVEKSLPEIGQVAPNLLPHYQEYVNTQKKFGQDIATSQATQAKTTAETARTTQQTTIDAAEEARKVTASTQPKFENVPAGHDYGYFDPIKKEFVKLGSSEAKESLQSKEIVGPGGRPSFANFNPKTGQYLDPQTGAVLPNARPYERPQDPAIAQLRDVQTRLAQMQIEGMGLTPNQRANEINTLRSQWTKATAPIMERRSAVAKIDSGLKQLESGNFRDSTQILITAFNKLLDEISVVREGEYERTSEGQALKDRIVGSIDRLQRGGTSLTRENLQQLGQAAKELAQSVGTAHEEELRNVREGIEKTLDDYKIPQDRVFGQSQIGKTKGGDTSSKVITPALIQSNMRNNPSATREQIIEALKAAGYSEQ